MTHKCKHCGEILSCSKTYYKKDGSINVRPTHTDKCKLTSCRKCAGIDRSGENHPLWKAARTKNAAGYIVVTAKKNKLEYEHRLVMEEYLGRKLEPNEHIHHINGIKYDNRISNLSVTDKMEHSKTTFKGRKHTKEAREKVRQSQLGEGNSMYGKPAWNRKVKD